MQNISIDFISQNDIRISIDGKKIENISSFSLKIKEGKNPKCVFEKKAFKEQNQLEVIKGNKVPQLRTIREAVEALKKEDTETAITEYAVRQLINQNKIPFSFKGRTKVVDLNVLKSYFSGEGKTPKVIKRKIEPAYIEPIF